jgi:ribosomal-protein-serine acetyltransferase
MGAAQPPSFTLADGIVLRPLCLSDAPAHYACARKNAERLRPWFYWVTDRMDLAETQQYLLDVQAQPDPPPDRPYGFFDRDTFAGSIGLYSIDFVNRIARIGYWIDADYEGKGLVTQGARNLINYAFTELGLNRIEIRCAPQNTASRAVPTRLGFIEEGLHRQVLAMRGEFQDLIMYAMLARDWAVRQAHHDE